MRALIALLLLLSPVLAKASPGGKTEKEFRKAEPEIHRQALWLEANPNAETWSDTLKIVLTWGHEVPYVTLGTAKVLEKEVLNLPHDAVAGRISSMLLVGYIQLATEPGFKQASEFDMAKAGITCMIRYYENVRKDKTGYTLPLLERLAGLYQSDALDEYIQAKLRK